MTDVELAYRKAEIKKIQEYTPPGSVNHYADLLERKLFDDLKNAAKMDGGAGNG